MFQHIARWFRSNEEHLVCAFLPEPGDAQPLRANESYVRIWLSEMFVARARDWGREIHPSVQAAIRLNFAGRDGVEFTRAARPPENLLGRGAWRNYELSSLVPFRGGTIEIEAGLVPLKGADTVGAALDVLKDVSSLVGPPLGAAIGIAQTVSRGIDRVVEAAQGEVALGLHETFNATGAGGPNVLRPGYLAVVNPSSGDLAPKDLRVVGSGLHVARGDDSEPLTGHDYMLLRIEGRLERDDWRFASFEELIGKAVDAYFRDDEAGYEGYRKALLAEIFTSDDLTEPDRRRVAGAVKRQLDAIADEGHGAVDGRRMDLEAIVGRHGEAIEDLLGLEPMRWDELWTS